MLGPYKESLIVVRSLARAGFRVIVGSESRWGSYPERSRYTAEIWRHPVLSLPEFVSALQQYVASHPDLAYVVPVGDLLARALAPHWETLPRPPVFVMASPGAVLKCQSKLELCQLAKSCGIPVPEWVTVDEADTLLGAVHDVGFPCVIKANETPKLFLEKEKAMVCHSEVDVVTPDPWPAGAVALVQRWVPGLRRNCHFVARQGRVLAYFEQQVLRTDHFDGTGLGVDSVSVAPTPELSHYTGRLVWELAYSGPGCAQFLRDDATSAAMFLELNPRFDSTIALPYQCGCDLPLVALQAAGGKEIVAPEYKAGKRIRWLVRDMWTTGWVVVGRKGGLGMRLSQLRRFGQSVFVADYDMTFEYADPVPAFHAGFELLESGWRRFRGALGLEPHPPRTRSPR